MCSRPTDKTDCLPEAVYSKAGWLIHRYRTVESTNDCARTLPAWSAVWAEVQTAGRGRTGRKWVSDPGGLWLTAVLPTPGERKKWEVLPLAAGWAMIHALRHLGVSEARLRWPNDIMVGGQKLAGLLAERFCDESVAVGIGLNVENAPASVDPDLAGATVSLAELVSPVPERSELLDLILQCLHNAHETIVSNVFDTVCKEMNANWSCREVEVVLTGTERAIRGLFEGVKSNGDIRIVPDDGVPMELPASKVELLREVSAT